MMGKNHREHMIGKIKKSKISKTVSTEGVLLILDETDLGLKERSFSSLTNVNSIREVSYEGSSDEVNLRVLNTQSIPFILFTSDKKMPVTLSSNFSVVRFTNNNLTKDEKTVLLKRLFQTKGFRDLNNLFGKDIRLSKFQIDVFDGEVRRRKKLFREYGFKGVS